jgi:hypothetical protein
MIPSARNVGCIVRVYNAKKGSYRSAHGSAMNEAWAKK